MAADFEYRACLPGEAVVEMDGVASKVMPDRIMAADKARLKGPLGRFKRADMRKVEAALSPNMSTLGGIM